MRTGSAELCAALSCRVRLGAPGRGGRPCCLVVLTAVLSGLLAWNPGASAAELPEVHGFLQAHAAARLGDVDCPPETACDWPFNEQSLQLKTEGGGLDGTLGYAGKLDLVHDAVRGDTAGEVRELYADYNVERATVRAGRQVITWGVADLLFINDTFPKDWVSFFGGLPLEYLKRGSDALRLDIYPGMADLELVLARFRKDLLPNRERFVLPGPDLGVTADAPSEPEISLRVSRNFGGWDAALYLSGTHFHTPALTQKGGELLGEYPRLNTYGASLAGPLWSGVLSLETGYYDSLADREGADPAVDNSQTRFLVGYSRQVAEDTTLGLQAYAEWMLDYDAYRRTLPEGFPRRDDLRTVATLRFTQFHLHQTLRLGLFAFWGLSEGDGYLIPSARYAFSDALWVEVGANLFVGDRDGQFGALGDNDNIYATLRHAF